MIKRRFSLVVGATTALVGGTYAVADAASAQASTPDMRAEVSTSDLPAIASPTIDARSLSTVPTDVLTGGVGGVGSIVNPTTAMATLTSDPISTINALLGTVAGADPTGLVSGVIQGLGGNPVSIVAGVVSNPSGAVSSLLSNPTGAVSGVLDTVSQADPTGLVGSVVNTVTSQVSVPAIPVLPVVGDVTSTVSNTLNSVTGTVNGLLGSVPGLL